MTTKVTGQDVINKQLEAWNRHDAEGVAANYAQNVTVLDPYYPEPLAGREAVKKDAADFFTAFPDITFKITKVIESGGTIGYEAMIAGTHTGPLPGPTGVIPATNRRLEFSGAGFFELDDAGNIREERRYYDVAGQLAQLGLMQ